MLGCTLRRLRNGYEQGLDHPGQRCLKSEGELATLAVRKSQESFKQKQKGRARAVHFLFFFPVTCILTQSMLMLMLTLVILRCCLCTHLMLASPIILDIISISPSPSHHDYYHDNSNGVRG